MPIDPDTEGMWKWLAGLVGIGGSGALVKTVLTASETQTRIRSLETSRKDHDGRLDEVEGTMKVLEERSLVAVRDRAEILASLQRIEGRIR